MANQFPNHPSLILLNSRPPRTLDPLGIPREGQGLRFPRPVRQVFSLCPLGFLSKLILIQVLSTLLRVQSFDFNCSEVIYFIGGK